MSISLAEICCIIFIVLSAPIFYLIGCCYKQCEIEKIDLSQIEEYRKFLKILEDNTGFNIKIISSNLVINDKFRLLLSKEVIQNINYRSKISSETIDSVCKSIYNKVYGEKVASVMTELKN